MIHNWLLFQRRILNTAKADAQMFAGDDGRLELQDQTGKEVDLPKAEKDALVMAMSLHQKGRAAMKKGNFELGLVLLLEATEEFENCRAEILNVIDNYGEKVYKGFNLAWHAFAEHEKPGEAKWNRAKAFGTLKLSRKSFTDEMWYLSSPIFFQAETHLTRTEQVFEANWNLFKL